MLKNFFKTLEKIISNNEENEDFFREKIISDFKAEKQNYELFSSTIHKLIEALLIQGGYKYQLHSRVKDLTRLEEKIKRKHLLGKSYKKLSDIEDLVGLRIIFYTERDKVKFINDIKKEITGLFRFEEKAKGNGYSAVHIIASFGKKRLALAEYKQFAGLKCEIQITSAIHHAWAEVEHDIIYKDINGLENISPEKYRHAKIRLSEILEKYIKKASAEFEEVIKEIGN